MLWGLSFLHDAGQTVGPVSLESCVLGFCLYYFFDNFLPLIVFSFNNS